jgi:hypothetical protein
MGKWANGQNWFGEYTGAPGCWIAGWLDCLIGVWTDDGQRHVNTFPNAATGVSVTASLSERQTNLLSTP